MIVFYSASCEGCAGNHALTRMKTLCNKYGVDFQERRTILWKVYAQEANEIMELNPGLKKPFFYSTNTGEVLVGNSFTPEGQIKKLIDLDNNDEGA